MHMLLQIKSSVLAVYKSIVSLRSVALMEEAYRLKSFCLLSTSESFCDILKFIATCTCCSSVLHILFASLQLVE